MHFANNILKSSELFQSIHLILPKGFVQQRWEHYIQTNENFQVRENRPQQILIFPTNVVKLLQKIGTIQVVKHVFVWRIVYEQIFANMSVRKFRNENVKVLMENWLVMFIQQEMWISHANVLFKHFGSMYRYLCFVPYLIQIIIDIVTLGCQPYIKLKLCKTFLQEFLQSRMENDGAKTFIEACGDQNSIQIENHMKWTHFYYM